MWELSWEFKEFYGFLFETSEDKRSIININLFLSMVKRCVNYHGFTQTHSLINK